MNFMKYHYYNTIKGKVEGMSRTHVDNVYYDDICMVVKINDYSLKTLLNNVTINPIVDGE